MRMMRMQRVLLLNRIALEGRVVVIWVVKLRIRWVGDDVRAANEHMRGHRRPSRHGLGGRNDWLAKEQHVLRTVKVREGVWVKLVKLIMRWMCG